MATTTQIPLLIAIAPFPEGFKGDLDETFQQAVQLMSIFIEGNFLQGQVLPPGSTLPATDQGPIAMGGIWYFWNPATGEYEPQVLPTKFAKNFAKNCVYQVQQTGNAIAIVPSGTAFPGAPAFDMSFTRANLAGVLSISAFTGPPAGGANDLIPSAINYTVQGTLVPTPASTDLYAHEHLFEGCDIIMLQGEVLTLAFWVYGSTPGTYSAYLTSAGRNASYVVTFNLPAANTWTLIVVPNIPPFPTAAMGNWNWSEGVTGLYVGIAMAVGTQWQTGSLKSWQPAFLAGSSANQNLLTQANNRLAITGIKLEAASSPTFLSVPSFADDLEAASRYYFTNFLYQSLTQGVPIQFAANQSGSWAASYIFPRRMAQNPKVVPYSYVTQSPGLITDMSITPPFDIPVATLPATKRGIAGTGVSSIVTTGTLDGTSGTITAIPSTAGISAGATVTGAGIPAGATVVSILGPSSLTLSVVTTVAGTNVALTFSNFTTLSTTGTVTLLTTTGTTAKGSITITALASTTGIVAGMPISGAGIPSGAVVVTGPVGTGTSITISIAATAAGSSVTLNFGTKAVTGIPSTTGIVVGMPVTGTGIPQGTTVATVPDATDITLSNYVITAGTDITLSFGVFNKGDLFWALIKADARLT